MVAHVIVSRLVWMCQTYVALGVHSHSVCFIFRCYLDLYLLTLGHGHLMELLHRGSLQPLKVHHGLRHCLQQRYCSRDPRELNKEVLYIHQIRSWRPLREHQSIIERR